MTVDSRRSQDFYTLLVQEEIKVEFEIENIMQESFVTLNQGNESVSIEQFVLTASQYLNKHLTTRLDIFCPRMHKRGNINV